VHFTEYRLVLCNGLFIVKLIKLLFFRLFCYRINHYGEIKIFNSFLLPAVMCRLKSQQRVIRLLNDYRHR